MKKAPYLAPISVMLHDISRGQVQRDVSNQVTIDYALCADDLNVMAMGLIEAGRILFAAGAREVVVPIDPLLQVASIEELELSRERIALALVQHRLELVSVHPMSSVWMGNDEKSGPVNPQGRLYRSSNLRIADTSLYPTSLGVPPQLTTYMAGIHVADGLLG